MRRYLPRLMKRGKCLVGGAGSWQDKTTPRTKRGVEIKRVADAGEEPIVIPIVAVVAVDVHIALVVVPPVERRELYGALSIPLPVESLRLSPSCI